MFPSASDITFRDSSLQREGGNKLATTATAITAHTIGALEEIGMRMEVRDNQDDISCTHVTYFNTHKFLYNDNRDRLSLEYKQGPQT